ncbi:hypothetical protein C1H46_043361 [Malus baccata]|uniref:Uncharacterized protein n=1 Tax=Malus baccata TaxID=106549 RepID=A0A540KA62_MALBA|nr:hypothetical protein C1H46_043361 [Malus baccata]
MSSIVALKDNSTTCKNTSLRKEGEYIGICSAWTRVGGALSLARAVRGCYLVAARAATHGGTRGPSLGFSMCRTQIHRPFFKIRTFLN